MAMARAQPPSRIAANPAVAWRHNLRISIPPTAAMHAAPA